MNKINPKNQYYKREKLKKANIKDMRDMTLRELLLILKSSLVCKNDRHI